MLDLDIPGRKPLVLKHLVLDYNGTLALDGEIRPGVMEQLYKLYSLLDIHVLTADTHGTVRDKFAGTRVHMHIIAPDNQDLGKLEYIRNLGETECICVGNGRNDKLMLQNAALGISVLQEEGCNPGAAYASDVLTPHINAALQLILSKPRLIATLRN